MNGFFRKHAVHIALIAILFLGFFFRMYNSNWDDGFHMHPDERAIVMAATQLSWPSSVEEFLSPESSLNPHFFAYGNFPIYALKGLSIPISWVTQDPLFMMYDKINLVGRFLSALADTGIILLLFLIGRHIRGKRLGLFAAFFYSIAVLPIQASHFYTVDILLTFFVTLTLFLLLRFYEKPTYTKAFFIGIAFGLSLATKISAFPLVFAIILSLSLDFILIFLKRPHHIPSWFPHIPQFLKRLLTKGVIIFLVTGITLILAQPYMILDFKEFFGQNLLQSEMTHNAFIFPYTLQYVGKIPYVYELQNVFFWGLGPIFSLLSLAGFFFSLFYLFKDNSVQSKAKILILLCFFLVYFAIVGRFAVGWSRYMLPLYPFFAFFAAFFLIQTLPLLKKNLRNWYIVLVLICIGSILVWPLSFLQIYTREPTRVTATKWIHNHISPGKTLAIEHWDDALPLYGQEQYTMVTLPLYDPDTPEKWERINRQLAQVDYIILASNRLYTPLQKLTDCKNLPPGRCYPDTAQHYQDLFAGKKGFYKVAEFSVYPTIPLLQIPIQDQSADEAFTVYDHPKIMIFKRY